MEKKSGWIVKEGGKGALANWKKRFLAIEDDTISYYTKPGKEKKGAILIKEIQNVRAIADYRGKEYVFKIITPNRVWIISAPDDQERSRWINSIQKVMPERTELKSSSSCSGIGDLLVARFEKLRVIGKGGYSTVYLVKKKDTNQYYAMKIMKKSQISVSKHQQQTKVERNILARVNHPFLIKLQCSFQTKRHLFFVMDFVNGGELFFHMTNEDVFTEERSRFYVAQIVLGLEYLHKRGIIYRDLKPENILLSNTGYLILTDFGLSKEGFHTNLERTATFCGTPEYLAPEVVLGAKYSRAIDWWSVGCILYEMLTGRPPFYDDDENNMYEKIVNSPLLIPDTMSEECCDLIVHLLDRNPETRLSDPRKIKTHPFFGNLDWAKLEKMEIEPPFKPKIKGPGDLANIDPEFLQMEVESSGSSESEHSDYEEFTYEENDELPIKEDF